MRNASCLLPDGVIFLVLLAVDEGFDNPLGSIHEFKAFHDDLKGWLTEPPSADRYRSSAPPACAERHDAA